MPSTHYLEDGECLMKIMAIHLPAFHRIPENDEWWGEGFTEWDNVRTARPLYPGHLQPVAPYMDWYYDLSNINDLRKQAELAKQYGVDGFVMYHYWFGNGRTIFEKPLELLLRTPDINIEYSLCWANHTWVTSWHGKEPKELIRQQYPGKEDWAAHIEYLTPFFRDSRYSKIGNKPVIYFYNAREIEDYSEMLNYWDGYLRDNGFDGLYAVEYISSKNRSLASKRSSAVMEFEPLYTMFFDISKYSLMKRALAKKTHRIDFQSYDELWEKILKRTRTYAGKPIFRSCNCAWDNSPRKEYDSMIIKGSTPAKFEHYLAELMVSQRADISDEYLIINAWNEWSEGAYLEPDMHNGFGFLEAIRNARIKAGV